MPGNTKMVEDFMKKHLNAEHGGVLYRLISTMTRPTTSGTFPFAEQGDATIKWDFGHVFNLTSAAIAAWLAAAVGLRHLHGLAGFRACRVAAFR